MPPDVPSPLSNQDILDILKRAPLEYEQRAKYEQELKATEKMKAEMQRYLQEDLQRAASPPRGTSSWDQRFQEQKAFKDLEERILAKMSAEVRRMTEDHAIKMSSLEMTAMQHREATERLITALVEQNRELSRRVTELEWEGITP